MTQVLRCYVLGCLIASETTGYTLYQLPECQEYYVNVTSTCMSMSKLTSLVSLSMALALTLSLLILVGCDDTRRNSSAPSTPLAAPTPVPGSYPSSNGAMARGNIQGTGVYDTRPLVQLP